MLARLTEVARDRPRRVFGKRRDKPTKVPWSFGAKHALERALREGDFSAASFAGFERVQRRRYLAFRRGHNMIVGETPTIVVQSGAAEDDTSG